MLSASFVAQRGAPRVKGLRAALVLAKAARFAFLDYSGQRPPLTPRPHHAKTLAFKKACLFYGDTRHALRAGNAREKHIPEERT